MSVTSEILGQSRRTLNYVWDPNALDWVAETQPATSGGAGGTVDQGAAGLDPWAVEFLTPQAVTGPLTDTELRATPVPVSGPLTDTQLRATPVPVSGTVTADAGTGPWPVTDNGGSLTVDGPLTDTQLRLTPVPVDASGAAVPVTDNGGSLTVDGTVTASAQPGVDIGDVTVNNAAGASAVNIQDGGNSLTVDNAALSVVGGGTEATALRVTVANDSTGVLSVDDNGSSLTVDNAALSVVGGGAESTALRVTIANDSTGVLSVDDNGGSLTIDGTVTVTHGKTIKTVSGSFTADTDVITAVTSKRLKVIAYAFFTFGTSATTLLLKSNGTGGTEVWRVALQAITSTVMGANLAVEAPSFLFATAAGEKLTADTDTGDTIHYSISYFDDDAA